MLILLVAIVIYNNSKSNKLTNTHSENIIQLHGSTTPIDVIINYCIATYKDIKNSLIVAHCHHPIKVKNRYVLGRSRQRKLLSGFYMWMLPAHTILINKDVYIVDEFKTYKEDNDDVYVTKIKVADIYFPNIQRTFYIATIKFKNSYFDEHTYSKVASFFEFLHKEPIEPHPIIVADFATQNWNSINRDWRHSTGNFRIPTYVDERGCVARNGFMYNTNLNGTLHVEHITDINIDCELITRLVLENHEHKIGSIKLGAGTEKQALSIKYRDTVNFVHSKNTIDKHSLILSNFHEYQHKHSYKLTPIEDIINSLKP